MATWSTRQAAAQVVVPLVADLRFTRSVISPTAIPKFADALPVAWDAIDTASPDAPAATTLVVKRESVPMLPATVRTSEIPNAALRTPNWVYRRPGADYADTHLGPTIVAAKGKPIEVTYDYTTLPDAARHLLKRGVKPAASPNSTVVDKTLHGTDGTVVTMHHGGGTPVPEPEVRFIAHLHGAKDIAQEDDGFAESWVTPDGRTYATYATPGYPLPVPNDGTFRYPNEQDATLLWYHDHALGNTRLNVYAGLAGGYLLRDQNEANLTFPGGAKLPAGPYEIPLVIQDRMFYGDGTLAYPDRPFNNLALVGVTPFDQNEVSILPEFFGDVIVVNGKAWPYLEVEPTTYRLRVLNGCDSRFLDLECIVDQTQAKLRPAVLGTEGGFLNNPITVNSLLMGPAERFDAILDFSALVPGQTVTVFNKGAKKPFPKGTPPNPSSDKLVMRFKVVAAKPTTPPRITVPATLQLRPVPVTLPPDLPTKLATPRRVLLAESVDRFGRIKPMLGTVDAAGTGQALDWHEPVTEQPVVGQGEVWEIYNTTADSHPIHIHETLFQVIDRQTISFAKGGTVLVTNIRKIGNPKPREAWETAYKDMVIAYPGEVVRIHAAFGKAGLFVWHCHILEHEDHEMMRPLRVLAAP